MFASLCVYHFRPLVIAAPWKCRVTHVQFGTVDAPVYQMIFRPDRLFVEVPKSHRDRYWWFALDVERQAVGVPNGPRQNPYLHQNHDMNLGVDLKDPKIEDSWNVDWLDGGVTFANDTLRVVVEK